MVARGTHSLALRACIDIVQPIERTTLIRGIIFDLDGTLVDSQLDFTAMREEMQLDEGEPILEAMEKLSEPRLSECRKILSRHEQQGVECSTKIAGVDEMLAWIDQQGLRRAVVTRNSRRAATAMVAKHNLHFDPLWTREDGPQKPDPWAIQETCRRWAVLPAEVVMVGDFRFDIESGQRAGSHTTYYRTVGDNDCGADYVLRSYVDCEHWYQWLLALD